MRPCHKLHPELDDNCGVCKIYRTSEVYRNYWDHGIETAPVVKKEDRCIHLGEPTGEKRLCESCTGKTELFIMRCEVHGECTIGRKITGTACCKKCQQKEVAA